VVQYRWHPLYGQRVRRIQAERRASGELVHVELTPGAVTILPVSILKNPFYAGVYAYGKSEKRTTIINGRARKSYGHSNA
jgi:hypothetical protein